MEMALRVVPKAISLLFEVESMVLSKTGIEGATQGNGGKVTTSGNGSEGATQGDGKELVKKGN